MRSPRLPGRELAPTTATLRASSIATSAAGTPGPPATHDAATLGAARALPDGQVPAGAAGLLAGRPGGPARARADPFRGGAGGSVADEWIFPSWTAGEPAPDGLAATGRLGVGDGGLGRLHAGDAADAAACVGRGAC